MTDPPILLTPGPLTTAPPTRRAMLADWGSWDDDFRDLTARVLTRLEAVAGARGRHVCVPVQGSGTYAVEAAIGTLVPRTGKVLVQVNGAYGHRLARICRIVGRDHVVYQTAEDAPPDPAELARRLAADPAITDVGVIHCETSSGILNPLPALAAVVTAAGRRLIVDAMSSFGALPVDVEALDALAVIASSNKGLEGVPGLAFVVCRADALAAAEGNAHSLSLDLHDQWSYMARTGQFRYTPPTQVLAALDTALAAFEAEGGQPGRHARYRANCDRLLDGMAALGFVSLLDRSVQAPIIATFRTPRDPNYRFERFYAALKRRGFIIYPGKTTQADSFRIGCIGAIGPGDITRLLDAVRSALDELGVTDTRPGADSADRTDLVMP